jgi:(R,R)-butanediol dehydrogenase/meso-butanediol dehydrogenase/diacetyl reductase
MRAALFTGCGHPLAIEDVPDPTPGDDEIVVRVARCGICGSDLHLTENPLFGLPPGTVLGHEYAGEIVAVGKATERLRVGDRVAVSPHYGCGKCATCLAGEPVWCSRMRLDGGGYGEFSLAAERQAVRLPATVSLEDGALVEPLAVGLHGINISGMRPGARVLVIGAGPIGLAVVFWAKRLGAGRIAVTAGSTRRAELALTMGATDFVAPDDDPVGSVNRALGGAPDIVYECVGVPGMIARSIEHVRTKGTVVVLGLCAQQEAFVPFAAVAKEVRIQTSAFFTHHDYRFAVDVLDRGALEPHAMITDTVSLVELPAAFEALRQRSHQCKVMVRPGD